MTQAMNDTPTTQKVQLEITWKSVMRVLLGVLLAYVAVLLWLAPRLEPDTVQAHGGANTQ